MVLSHDEIKKIVKGLSQRELDNPEGTVVDLRLGEVHKFSGGEAFIEADGAAGQGKRSMFQTELVAKFQEGSGTQEKLTVKPGDYYLVKTVESVDTPLDVMSDFRTRGTLFRSGLILLTSIGAPGYKGELIFGLYHAGPFPVTLQMGARICSAAFYRTENDGLAYRGLHMGGRVTWAGA
jgi:deoxycytidine triphosphate deaminase